MAAIQIINASGNIGLLKSKVGAVVLVDSNGNLISLSGAQGGAALTGPGSSTNNGIATWNGTNGLLLNSSPITLGSNALASASSLSVTAAGGNLSFVGNSQITVGSDFVSVISGTYNLGTAALPFKDINIAGNLNFDTTSNSFINGPQSATSQIIEFYQNGQIDISAGANQMLNLYGGGSISSVSQGTISEQATSGFSIGTNAGNITLTPSLGVISLAANTTPSTSGTLNLGSAANPFNQIYAKNIYNQAKTITANYNASTSDSTIFTNQSSSIQINFPPAVPGQEYLVLSTVSSAVNSVTLSGLSGAKIDGAFTKTISSATVGAGSLLIADGANFYTLSNLV